MQSQLIKGWRFDNSISLSNVNAADQQGYFLRPTFSITHRFAKVEELFGRGCLSIEHNEMRMKASDSVALQSFAFSNLQATFKSDEGKPNHWGIVYSTRTNSYPLGKELVKSDRSQNINIYAELLKNEHHQFRFNATYRTLDIVNNKVTAQLPDQTLLGRTEYQMNIKKGLLTGSLLYEAGAGQEQKRDLLPGSAGRSGSIYLDRFITMMEFNNSMNLR